MNIRKGRLAAAGVLLLIALAVVFQTARYAVFAMTPFQPGSAVKVIIEVSKGTGPDRLSKQLASAGVIADAQKMYWLGRLKQEWTRIKAGEYEVSPGQTPLEIFGVITSGISVHHPVTVREGENMYEIADDLETKKLATREQFLTLCKDPRFIESLGFTSPLPPSLEGYLFPETYFFNRTMPAEEMIRQMVRKFMSVWTDAFQARAAALKMTRHQVITLASMVEKETGALQERPLISSVFHNRLKKGMRLQSDPTTIYGIWEHYKGNIHKQDLLNPTPYNTYTVTALPIGPIGNPGRESIEAALNPAESEYYFFVSHNDGTHEFTRSFEDHNKAVTKFQIDRKAREGKSWRDLSKAQSRAKAQGQAQKKKAAPQNGKTGFR